jgi:hypothetical protein
MALKMTTTAMSWFESLTRTGSLIFAPSSGKASGLARHDVTCCAPLHGCVFQGGLDVIGTNQHFFVFWNF